MKIRLKSFNFDVVDNFGRDEVDLDTEPATLRGLLQELTQKSKGRIDLIDPQSGDFNEEYIVLVNKHEFRNLPQELETELNDGDEVQIGLLYVLEGG
jgi:molybdopterin converting factor small subunit